MQDGRLSGGNSHTERGSMQAKLQRSRVRHAPVIIALLICHACIAPHKVLGVVQDMEI